MGRHAKNNTNASAFTWAERQMTGTGTKKALLGRDSFKDFDACSLCLSRATDPRICTSGHVFCHECSLNSLLSQKKDIKRQTLLLDKMRVENEAEMSEQRAAARERVLKEFDSAQGALGVAKGEKGKERSSTGKEGETGLVGPRGTKRAFELDEEEIERLTKEATDEALRRTAKEMAESRKAKLPNFWLPSLTPSATPESIINIKLQTLCHASVPPHPLSLKTLTPIKFTQENPDDKSASPVVICPSCRTTITNNVACWALKACGDVLCATCVDTLCRTDKACAHCSTKLDKKLPFIELKREGTGFAAGGGVSVSKYDLAFQA